MNRLCQWGIHNWGFAYTVSRGGFGPDDEPFAVWSERACRRLGCREIQQEHPGDNGWTTVREGRKGRASATALEMTPEEIQNLRDHYDTTDTSAELEQATLDTEVVQNPTVGITDVDS